MTGCLLVAQCFCPGLLPTPAIGQPVTEPIHLTTDSPAYCLHLADRVHTMVLASAPTPSHEIVDLSTEGQRMCEHGQTRAGIMRLRRALVLMTHDARGADR